jgi:hypothetical protein
MRVPTSGASVFAPVTATATNNLSVTAGFPPDLAFVENRVNGINRNVNDRLRGGTTTSIISLESNSTGAEQTYTGNGISFNSNSTGIIDNFTNFNQGAGQSMVYWMFRRAPQFFDEVCYTGDGTTNRAITHNLTVAPELIIVKARSAANLWWMVYAQPLGPGKYLALQATFASGTDNAFPLAQTATNFYVSATGSDVNVSSVTFVAYLFATCPGVSKVGSYTGTGTTQTINCGFTAGSRFVLIKRTDSTGDWYVWDSARGIVAGNDPHLSLNSTAAEVTTNDSIDPDNSGFIVNQVAATNINVNAATYIYLAIA